MKNIFLLSAILFSTSCGIILKKIGGIKNPKLESYHSINLYINSLGLDSLQVLFAKDSTTSEKISKIFNNSTPDMVIFNKAGKLIPYKSEEKTCNASVDSSILNICNIEKNGYVTKKNVTLQDLFSLVVDPNNILQNFSSKIYDYTILINFVKYYDGINKTHLIPWDKRMHSIEAGSTCRVKLIFINQDYLNNWEMKSKIPKIKLN